MKIVVIGAGGIGGYFGGRWAEAGLDVTLVARGAQLEAIRSGGLAIHSPLGDAVVPIKAVARPDEAGEADVVVVATKTWQLTDALKGIAPLLRRDTLVLGLQNGVEAGEMIGTVVGAERAIEGTCRIISFIESPGVIKHAGGSPLIVFGERTGNKSTRLEKVRDEIARGKGMEVELTTDIQLAVWRKFHWFAPVAGVGSVTRSAAGAFRSITESRNMLIAAMNEVFSLAHARGVKLPVDSTDKAMAFVDSLPEDATSTMMRDFRDGKRTELDTLQGTIVRFGLESGVATPVNAFIYAALLPSEISARNGG